MCSGVHGVGLERDSLSQKGAAIYTSYTSLYKIIQYNLLFLVLPICTSYTLLYKIIQYNLLFI